jgi:hypothetical protein
VVRTRGANEPLQGRVNAVLTTDTSF